MGNILIRAFSDWSLTFRYTSLEFGFGFSVRKRATKAGALDSGERFAGWKRGGPLKVRYAIFANRRSTLFVAEYCLTSQTRAAIKAAFA